MLESKRIHIIALLLMAVVLILTVAALCMPALSDTMLGEVTYENGQTIAYSSMDYTTDYTDAAYERIVLTGTSAETGAANVTVSDGSVTISSGGVYELSGTLTGGSIMIDAQDGTLVRLVLNNADITATDSPAICIMEAAKTVITTAPDTLNTLTDAGLRADGTLDATLYSRDDLVLNGQGTLVLHAAYADGIAANDGLKIMSGTLEVAAADEGIKANDYIVLAGGTVTVNAGGDAIKCEHSNDSSLGFIVLDGGTAVLNSKTDAFFSGSDIYVNDIQATISAGDDAVHAEGRLYLKGGSVNITDCTEGFEGAYITIEDGDYHVVSRDDAFNAVGTGSAGSMPGVGGMGGRGAMSAEAYITINGGSIHASTGGDGLDSNAAAVINGGFIEVYGPENNGNSTLDFDGGFAVNGGTLLAAGSAGMAEAPTEESRQNVVIATLSKTYPAGTPFSLTDESGTRIAGGTSTKAFDWLCISCDAIMTGSSYTMTIDNTETITVTISSAVTNTGGTGHGFHQTMR